MDITLLSPGSLRIRGRNASIIVNPSGNIGKTEAEAILKLEKLTDFNTSKIEGYRIVIDGPGDYEVSGIKISAVSVEDKLVARLEVDGVKLVIGKGTLIEKIHDKVEGCDIGVINADSEFNYSILSALDPKVLVVYGDKKEDVKKVLGKDEAETLSKFSINADKLPAEMQMVLLG